MRRLIHSLFPREIIGVAHKRAGVTVFIKNSKLIKTLEEAFPKQVELSFLRPNLVHQTMCMVSATLTSLFVMHDVTAQWWTDQQSRLPDVREMKEFYLQAHLMIVT